MPSDITTILVNYSPWVFLTYILIKEIAPKLFPEFIKALSKKMSTEDRLFKLLESNTQVLVNLNLSLVDLSDTLKELSHRVNLIEENLTDNSSALRVASRLISK